MAPCFHRSVFKYRYLRTLTYRLRPTASGTREQFWLMLAGLCSAVYYVMLGRLDERDGHLPAYNWSRMKLAGCFADIFLTAVVLGLVVLLVSYFWCRSCRCRCLCYR